MGKKQVENLMKKLLVTGLDNYKWDSLSISQLLMLTRIIGFMESAKQA